MHDNPTTVLAISQDSIFLVDLPEKTVYPLQIVETNPQISLKQAFSLDSNIEQMANAERTSDGALARSTSTTSTSAEAARSQRQARLAPRAQQPQPRQPRQTVPLHPYVAMCRKLSRDGDKERTSNDKNFNNDAYSYSSRSSTPLAAVHPQQMDSGSFVWAA